MNLVGLDAGKPHKAIKASADETGSRNRIDGVFCESLPDSNRIPSIHGKAAARRFRPTCAVFGPSRAHFNASFHNIRSIEFCRLIACTQPQRDGKEYRKSDSRYVPPFATFGEDHSDEQTSCESKECEATMAAAKTTVGRNISATNYGSSLWPWLIYSHQGNHQKTQCSHEVSAGSVETENERFARRRIPLAEYFGAVNTVPTNTMTAVILTKADLTTAAS